MKDLIYDLKPVIWDEWVLFKNNFIKITVSSLMSPLLYMVAFGLGVSGTSSLKGISYLKFLLPGIIALTTMNGSYKAVSVKLITNRLYDKSFENYLTAPLSLFSYCLGKSIAGGLRGFYAGLLIIIISRLFGITFHINGVFFILMFLNGLTFASLGMLGALTAKSHADMNRFGTWIMLPMTFLCGTFFAPEKLPGVLRFFVNLLPLTHMSEMLRAVALYENFYTGSLLIVLLWFCLFFSLAYRRCLKIAA